MKDTKTINLAELRNNDAEELAKRILMLTVIPKKYEEFIESCKASSAAM